MSSPLTWTPSTVRAFSRAGDDVSLAQLPWPNLERGDVLVLEEGQAVVVVDVVPALPGSAVDALVKVDRLEP